MGETPASASAASPRAGWQRPGHLVLVVTPLGSIQERPRLRFRASSWPPPAWGSPRWAPSSLQGFLVAPGRSSIAREPIIWEQRHRRLRASACPRPSVCPSLVIFSRLAGSHRAPAGGTGMCHQPPADLRGDRWHRWGRPGPGACGFAAARAPGDALPVMLGCRGAGCVPGQSCCPHGTRRVIGFLPGLGGGRGHPGLFVSRSRR